MVITGIGPVSAFGLGIEPLWTAMIEGRSAIAPIRSFDATGFPCAQAAEVAPDLFDVKQIVPRSYRKATKVMASDIELAVGAAVSAIADAGIVTRGVDADAQPTIDPDRFGCHIGAGSIAADIDELTAAMSSSRDDAGEFDLEAWGRTGMQNLTPLWLLKYLPNMLACHVTIIHDCRGPSNTITCSEASSGLSLGESMRVIERDQADACLTGGAENKVNPMGLLRQVFAQRLAPLKGDEDVAHALQPFSPATRGSVLGSGGGLIVVEAAETAHARNAPRIYAEVSGFASSQSFCPDTVGIALDEDDESIMNAMQRALDDASITADDIDAIVPFGSGIPCVDRAEAKAIERVFDSRAASIPIITTIPNVGNCCAGAGAINLAVAARAIFEQTLPARLYTQESGGLDATQCAARAAELGHVMVISPSLGGQNVAIVLSAV